MAKMKRSYDKGYDMGYAYGEMKGERKEARRMKSKSRRGESKSVHHRDHVRFDYDVNKNRTGLHTGDYRIISAYPPSPMKRISRKEDVSDRGY